MLLDSVYQKLEQPPAFEARKAFEIVVKKTKLRKQNQLSIFKNKNTISDIYNIIYSLKINFKIFRINNFFNIYKVIKMINKMSNKKYIN